MAQSSSSASLLSGLAGATVLTAIHESVRRMTSDAPRMDTYGRRALAKGIEAAGFEKPSDDTLQGIALGGDILANALYFSFVGVGDKKKSLTRGIVLGALAGIGAVVLGPMMGLGKKPARKTNQTVGMTILWYTLGGLASALVYRVIDRE